MLPADIPNPMQLLATDHRRAQQQGDPSADLLFLATASAHGQPAVRTLMIREITATSVLVTSNHGSAKSVELRENPQYEVLIYWASLQRQYRVSGGVTQLRASELPQFDNHTPWRSRVCGWLHETHPQSSEIDSREVLRLTFDTRESELVQAHGSREQIPSAPHMGYLRLTANRVEVQHLDLEHRLHDRRLFTQGDGAWSSVVLVP